MSVINKIIKGTKIFQTTKCLSGYHSLNCERFYANSKTRDVNDSPLKGLLDESIVEKDRFNTVPETTWTTTPYPERLRQTMEKEAGLDNDEMSIIMFPGQGTHYLGMGQKLKIFPKAKELFDIASEVLKIDLLSIDTPSDLYKYCQELIVVCSLAAVEKLREERPSALESCVATAGFSLGEITALIFAGAIPLEQGIRLVSIRNAAMQAASKMRPGGMLTVLYSPMANISKICEKAVEHCSGEGIKDAFCCVATYLYPSCKVLAGTPMALEFIKENASELGIKAAKRVPVRGAFHSVGVEAAVEPFREALRMCNVDMPKVRVMSSVNGKEYKNVNHILKQLPTQISNPVKWEQLLHILYSRPIDSKFPRTFEVGPGKTLKTILRKVNAKAWDSCISVEA